MTCGYGLENGDPWPSFINATIDLDNDIRFEGNALNTDAGEYLVYLECDDGIDGTGITYFPLTIVSNSPP